MPEDTLPVATRQTIGFNRLAEAGNPQTGFVRRRRAIHAAEHTPNRNNAETGPGRDESAARATGVMLSPAGSLLTRCRTTVT
jgi:hypothetical protein